MDIKKDIETRDDIEKFLLAFYTKVRSDETIGFIFTKIIPVNWDKHIPVITDFWETILLDNPVYRKNAMEVHYHINKIFPLLPEHFAAWLHLFKVTLDHMYAGSVTELAKKRAEGIAKLMEFNMQQESNRKA